MAINVNHSSFISFLENVTSIIISEIDVSSYFTLTPEKRLKIQKAVFVLLKKSLKTRALVTDVEIKAFVVVLQKKSIESENYEISAVLKDIIVNFDSIIPSTEKKKSTSVKINQ